MLVPMSATLGPRTPPSSRLHALGGRATAAMLVPMSATLGPRTPPSSRLHALGGRATAAMLVPMSATLGPRTPPSSRLHALGGRATAAMLVPMSATLGPRTPPSSRLHALGGRATAAMLVPMSATLGPRTPPSSRLHALGGRATAAILVPMSATLGPRTPPGLRLHALGGRATAAIPVSMFGALTGCSLAPWLHPSCGPRGARGVAALDEPRDGVAEGVLGGCLGQAQLANGLGRAEVHALPSHAHGVEGHRRRLARHARRTFHAAGGEPRDAVRHAKARGRQPGEIGEGTEDLEEGEIAVAEHVLLADPPPIGGEDVAARDVAHVDDVEAGVDGADHLAAQEVHHHLPGGRGLHVPRPQRGRGIDDHDGGAAGCPFQRDPFGEE